MKKDIYSLNAELLDKYVLDSLDKNFLYLHPFPTGSGKTTSVKFLIEKILTTTKKNIIYIINNKKGRDEVYKSLENTKDVILLESEVDDFINNKEKIIFALKQLKYEDEGLISILDLEIDIKLKNTLLLPKIQELKNFYKSKSKKLKKTELQELKSTLKILFPTIDMKKRVLILTTQKFLNSLTDFPYNYYLYEKYKNSLIIIDEFDTQKNEFLNKITDDSSNVYIDKIEFIREFYHKYQNREKLLEHFDEKLDISYNHKTLLKEIEKFYYKYNLKDKIFIKKENEIYNFFIPIIENCIVEKLSYKPSPQEAKNYINEGDYDFFEIYKKANIFFDKYINLVITYIDKITKEKLSNEYSYDTLFKLELDKYLENIFPKENYLQGFYKNIKEIIYQKKYSRNTIKKYKIKNNKLKFYDNPFDVIELEIDNYSKIVKVESYNLQTTPEMFLAYLSNNFSVLGLSATALIESKLENFSLDIIENLKYPTKNELIQIRKAYKQKIKQKKFVFDVIKTKESIEDNLKYFLEDQFRKYAIQIINMFENLPSISDENKEYKFKKFMNLAQTYIYFYENDLESFLHLTSFNFKDDELKFIYKLIIIFIYLKSNVKAKNIKYSNIKELLSFLKYVGLEVIFNENFLSKTELENILSITQVYAKKTFTKIEDCFKNNKLFLISNYSFMAKGQNIHYENNGVLKDFEGVFLDEKTNILEIEIENKQQLLKLFYKLYILYFYKQITYNELVYFVKNLKTPINNLNFFRKSDEYVFVLEILFIQAIGRLLRTTYSQTHHILFDESFIDVIINFDRDDETLPVIDEMVVFVKNYLKNKNQKIIQEINEKSKKANKLKNMMLESFYKNKKDYIKVWQEIRDFLLKNPTLPNKTFKNKNFQKYKEIFYFENKYNKYFYKNYDEVVISDFSITKKSGYSEFSLEALKLKELSQIKELKEIFKNKISLDFSNKLVMIPFIYTNFYKGALGEIIGKKIFEIANIPLKEIKGIKYETFDFEIKDKVYVDFKFYNLITLMNYVKKDSLIENIIQKIEDNNLENSTIFIVNILKDKKLNDYLNTKMVFTNEDISSLKNNKIIFISHLIDYDTKYKIDYSMLNKIKGFL